MLDRIDLKNLHLNFLVDLVFFLQLLSFCYRQFGYMRQPFQILIYLDE